MGGSQELSPDVNTGKKVVGVDLGHIWPQPGSILPPVTLSLNLGFKS